MPPATRFASRLCPPGWERAGAKYPKWRNGSRKPQAGAEGPREGGELSAQTSIPDARKNLISSGRVRRIPPGALPQPTAGSGDPKCPSPRPLVPVGNAGGTLHSMLCSAAPNAPGWCGRGDGDKGELAAQPNPHQPGGGVYTGKGSVPNFLDPKG